MAYATADDMVIHCDSRNLCELVSDNDEAVDVGTLSDNAVLAAFMEAAEGEINADILTGNRYSIDELEAMTGSGSAMLKQMVCHMAFIRLMRRRGKWDEETAKWEESLTARRNDLRKGLAVFPLRKSLEAGNAALVAATPLTVQTAGLLRDRVPNYYPRRTFVGYGATLNPGATAAESVMGTEWHSIDVTANTGREIVSTGLSEVLTAVVYQTVSGSLRDISSELQIDISGVSVVITCGSTLSNLRVLLSGNT